MSQSQPVWNSLEIAKLSISLLTPLILLVVSIWVARLTERFRSMMWSNQKVIEKRIEIYDKMAPLLNNLYCYYLKIGSWKESTPPQIVQMKRELDRTLHIYAALFSENFIKCYFSFINICFETYVGSGKDAKLRTSIDDIMGNRKDVTKHWDDNWDTMFSEKNEVSDSKKVENTYWGLMQCFAGELGIGVGNKRD